MNCSNLHEVRIASELMVDMMTEVLLIHGDGQTKTVYFDVFYLRMIIIYT